MKLIVILVILLTTVACTSMLMGSSGESAGSAIGQDPRSAAQISADDRITAAIRSQYALDEELVSLHLGIESRRGTVSLRGAAQSFAQRDRAVAIATDIDGVIRVDNQINVNSN